MSAKAKQKGRRKKRLTLGWGNEEGVIERGILGRLHDQALDLVRNTSDTLAGHGVSLLDADLHEGDGLVDVERHSLFSSSSWR